MAAASSSSSFYPSVVELPFKRRTSSLWSSSRALIVKDLKQSKKPVQGCVCSSIFGDLVSGLPLEEIQRILQDENAVSSTIRNGITTIFGDLVSSLPLEEIQRILQDDNAVSSSIRNGIATIAELPDEKRWQTLGGAAFGWVYLTARPNVLWGAVDAFLLAPLQFVADKILGRRGYKRTDFLVEQRVGEGSFGTVFAGALVPRKLELQDELGRRSRRIEEFDNYKSFQKVILKKVKVGVSGAEECGEMEEWFNYRMSRAAPDVCADFLGSFIADTTRGQFIEGGRWLIWKYEGDSTLADFMKDRSFPENLSDAMFGTSLRNRDSLRRNALIIKKITRQVITSLRKVHNTGIIHRDVKPSNLVITNKGRVKLIDFGAATDLRVGKNYVPSRTMLDPDYCPPELYVMPEQTPKPPPAPVAAALSPLIWQFNSPDLYDMYSVGIIFMQMACPSLRSPAGMQSFKAELEEVKYNLKKWRQKTRLRPNLEILDYDGGKGWDLATKLICQRGFLRRGRLSAGAALRHPYFLLGAARNGLDNLYFLCCVPCTNLCTKWENAFMSGARTENDSATQLCTNDDRRTLMFIFDVFLYINTYDINLGGILISSTTKIWL